MSAAVATALEDGNVAGLGEVAGARRRTGAAIMYRAGGSRPEGELSCGPRPVRVCYVIGCDDNRASLDIES